MTEEVHQYPHRAEVLRLTYLLAHEPVNSRPNIRWWVLSAALVICVGVLGCTGGSEYPLVGRWILQREGVAATMPYKLEWEFTEDQIVVRIVRASGDSQQASRNRYTIDTTKTPKWITVTLNDDGHQEIRPGIFRLVGDELHLKQAIGGGPRPLSFGTNDYSVLKKLGQQDGAANGSQPIRSETNSTSSVPGSRR